MIVVTNRDLCKRPFLDQLESILAGGPEIVILREKSLSDDELSELARKCKDLCEKYDIPFSLNGNLKVANELRIDRVHLQMHLLRTVDCER